MKISDIAVVAVFRDRVKANEALMALLSAGFTRDQIGVVFKDPNPEAHGSDLSHDMANFSHTPDAKGAMAGALTGLGLGALAGLGILTGVIPVVGPAIAGGTLGVILSNAAAGAGIAGLVGTLIGAGVPHDEAVYFESEFQSGGILMTVNTHDHRDEAYAILRSHGAHNLRSKPIPHSATGPHDSQNHVPPSLPWSST